MKTTKSNIQILMHIIKLFDSNLTNQTGRYDLCVLFNNFFIIKLFDSNFNNNNFENLIIHNPLIIIVVKNHYIKINIYILFFFFL